MGGGLLALGLVLAALLAAPAPARAMELCSAESRELMRSVGIADSRIEALCERARRAEALLAVSLVRLQDELGYCRVTLSLQNNTTEFVNSLALSAADSRFEIFRFTGILPGGTGYASASSRILLACDEVDEIGLSFHWPASLRVGDRSLSGRMLERYKPVLLHPALSWSR